MSIYSGVKTAIKPSKLAWVPYKRNKSTIRASTSDDHGHSSQLCAWAKFQSFPTTECTFKLHSSPLNYPQKGNTHRERERKAHKQSHSYHCWWCGLNNPMPIQFVHHRLALDRFKWRLYKWTTNKLNGKNLHGFLHGNESWLSTNIHPLPLKWSKTPNWALFVNVDNHVNTFLACHVHLLYRSQSTWDQSAPIMHESDPTRTTSTAYTSRQYKT